MIFNLCGRRVRRLVRHRVRAGCSCFAGWSSTWTSRRSAPSVPSPRTPRFQWRAAAGVDVAQDLRLALRALEVVFEAPGEVLPRQPGLVRDGARERRRHARLPRADDAAGHGQEPRCYTTRWACGPFRTGGPAARHALPAGRGTFFFIVYRAVPLRGGAECTPPRAHPAVLWEPPSRRSPFTSRSLLRRLLRDARASSSSPWLGCRSRSSSTRANFALLVPPRQPTQSNGLPGRKKGVSRGPPARTAACWSWRMNP